MSLVSFLLFNGVVTITLGPVRFPLSVLLSMLMVDWRIILLFVLGGLLVPVFGFWEWYTDAKALVPLSILKNRTQIGASIFMFCLMCAMLGGTYVPFSSHMAVLMPRYQLPLYYQSGRNHSPEQSGIDIIPFMLAVCIGIFVSGGAVSKSGHYYPWLVGG